MNLAAFFAGVRPLFGGALDQRQVDAINAILNAWERYGDGNPRHLAYILATAKHETGDFQYMREIWGPTDAQRRYEGRADLGNTQKGDGKRFMGRGMVMITGRRNYADWSKRLDVDLVAHPQRAEDLNIAARILVEGMIKGTFTGKKLADYPSDFVESRRVVNGTDRATKIAGYAYSFLQAIEKAAEKPVTPQEPAPGTSTTPEATKPAGGAPAGGRAGLIAFLVVIIGGAVAAGWQHIISLIERIF